VNIAFQPWPNPPLDLDLSSEEVHVWRLPLDRFTGKFEEFRDILSQNENERADRFRFEKDRRNYVVRHGLMRILLGGIYLRCQPSTVRFIDGSCGKPAIVSTNDYPDLRFNLSHSDGLALFALGKGRELGIDLERENPDKVDEGMVNQFFHQTEARELSEAPREDRIRNFFRCWTRKEAYVKARGKGLSLPLDSFAVTTNRNLNLTLKDDMDPDEAYAWKFLNLTPAIGFAGCLVVQGSDWRLRCWDVKHMHLSECLL
jgi:4'-phosphopantetheinyl transferase